MESPCILVCSIDMESGFCHGCGRTSQEITAWTRYTDEQRAQLMRELPARVETLEKKPRRVTKRRALKQAKSDL